MQRSDAVQVSGYPEDAPVSPDGTPPSSGLAEEAYQRYAPLTYSGSARRPWLGADTLQEATSSPPEAIPDKLVNGYVASGRDQVTDILSLMEATWFGSPSSSYGTSNGSGFSGFHDSATSMSPGKRPGKALAAQKDPGGSGGSRDSSGRSGRSAGSTGSNPVAVGEHEPLAMNGAAPVHAGDPANGMLAVPEGAAVTSSAAHQPLEGAQNRRAGAGLGGFLGTWTKRQVHYQRQLPPPSLPAQIPGTPQAAAAAAHSSSSRAKRRSPAAAAAAAGGAAAAAQLPASSAAAGEGRTPGGSRRPSAERTSEAGEAGGAAEGLADADAARAVLLASEEGKVAAAAAAAEPDAAPSGRSEDSAGGLGEDEEGARQAAWRWRFNKRWAQEQARQMDPEYGRHSADSDGWDDALGYMDACGPGWHLQIARTTSDDGLANGSLISHASGLSTCLLGESHPRSHQTLNAPGDGSAMGEATKGIVQKARMAADLYQQQAAIESRVKQRWDTASHAGASWAGHELPAVQIDAFGRFTYVLVKLSDRGASAPKLLVRGKNGRSEAQLLSAVTKEVLGVTSRGRLPQAAVTLMGSGEMEWSRERDRVINVSAGRMVAGMEGSIHSAEDVARLAAALTRASLPMHYHVNIEGEKAA